MFVSVNTPTTDSAELFPRLRDKRMSYCTTANYLPDKLWPCGSRGEYGRPEGMIGMVGAIRKGLVRADINISPSSVMLQNMRAVLRPFRDAAESIPVAGNRKSHQMDPASRPIRQSRSRGSGGAPRGHDQAGSFLLGCHRPGQKSFPGVPLATYNVSGNTAWCGCGGAGWIDPQAATVRCSSPCTAWCPTDCDLCRQGRGTLGRIIRLREQSPLLSGTTSPAVRLSSPAKFTISPWLLNVYKLSNLSASQAECGIYWVRVVFCMIFPSLTAGLDEIASSAVCEIASGRYHSMLATSFKPSQPFSLPARCPMGPSFAMGCAIVVFSQRDRDTGSALR